MNQFKAQQSQKRQYPYMALLFIADCATCGRPYFGIYTSKEMTRMVSNYYIIVTDMSTDINAILYYKIKLK